MQRRHILAGFAALPLAVPALAGQARGNTLRFVPQANLSVLDPVWTTATVTSAHGYYVFDTLYGVDGQQRPRPQMAEGAEVSADGLGWHFRLREGLRFHDGSPVRSADCIASLRRWAVRDPFGQVLARVVAEWQVVDDRNFVIRLTRPFPRLLDAIGKPEAPTAFIMPERLAATDPNRPISEMIGSGPYRFMAAEYNSGSRVVYERFADYRPRAEPPAGTAGAKQAHFPRIEWHVIPDPATAAAALVNGEVDWWERPHPDLQALLARSREVRREVMDTAGRLALMRLNHLQPPFDDVRLRRAVMLSVVQEDYMRAAQGNDSSAWTTCRSLWPKRTPYHDETDTAALMPGSVERARAALREAGYANQKVAIINPTDFPDIGPLGQVTADALKRAGMNVDLLDSDWGTVVQRRNSREPVERGGWSIFHTTGSATGYGNPASSSIVRGQGRDGWFGWWTSPEAEALTEAWLYAADPAAERAAAGRLGQLAMAQVATIPLGQFTIRTAFRRDLLGMVPASLPVPWNLRRG